MHWSAPNYFPFTGASFWPSIVPPFTMSKPSTKALHTHCAVPRVALQHYHKGQERSSHQRRKECTKCCVSIFSFRLVLCLLQMSRLLFFRIGRPSTNITRSHRSRFLELLSNIDTKCKLLSAYVFLFNGASSMPSITSPLFLTLVPSAKVAHTQFVLPPMLAVFSLSLLSYYRSSSQMDRQGEVRRE